jgi:AraC-like DNA-binding protein
MVSLGDGDEVVTIGGHVNVNVVGRDLLRAALPRVTVVRAESIEAPTLQWLLASLHGEMTTPAAGSDFAVHQQAQLLLVEILRLRLLDADALPAGWLRVLADDRLAPAVKLIHEHPDRPWHLEDLARAATMSRTSFATRFAAVAGVPALRYLHEWRMLLAERSLRNGDETLSTIALSLGYASVSAFSTAFKRTAGIAPKRYREAARKEKRTSPSTSVPSR